MAKLLNGWFADRSTGQGKPRTAGGVVVPVNGIVGAGLNSAGSVPAFNNNPTAQVRKASLLNGWFTDRASGQGKPFTGAIGLPGAVNGPWPFVITEPIPPGPGGKYYFELTVGAISAGGHNLDLAGSPQFGFLNAHQRDTINSGL